MKPEVDIRAKSAFNLQTMGRIKSLAVKRTTRKLMSEHPEMFSKDYEGNKKVLNRISECSKKTRNCLAGYITRTARKNK